MYCYKAYDIHFRSGLEFPEVAQTVADQPCAVSITTGAVPPFLEGQEDPEAYYQVEPHRFLLKIEEVARYLVSGGSEIVVEPAAGASPDTVRLFLHGSAMGALLYQRGLLPLHGSAVETSQGAMVFIGPQGIGKSTLAAHLQRRGYRMLSDDVCVVSMDPSGVLQALPAFPKMRLCPDAVERLGQDAAGLRRARFDGDKFIVPASDHCSHPVRLNTVHLLAASDSPRIAIDTMSGFSRMDHLISNLYRAEYLHGMASEAAVMRLAFCAATRVNIKTVSHNRDHRRMEELIDRLEEQWEKEKGEART